MAGNGIQVEPADQYNEELAGQVHPRDWHNPTPDGPYNLVVIGAGTAGLVTAAGAAGLGAKVALVERHLLGGDCLNVGCVPSKCLIRASRAAADARMAGNYHVTGAGEVSVDFAAAMERMRRIRAHISHHDSANRFRDLGVDVFFGEARFSGPRTVEVGGETLHFRKAVIATGARAYEPPIPGLAEAGFLTNETVFSLTELPPRLAVLGAGPIGCEMAQAFRRCGSDVTLFDKAGHILVREAPDAAEILQEAFSRDGIRLVLNSTVNRVEGSGREKRLCYTREGETRAVEVDAILVGVGRVPNVDSLNLEAAGIKYDERHGVAVDDRLRTTNRAVYAAGDICMKHKFTHAADAAARIAIQNALFWGRKKLSALTIPWCTYTDPEIAHVGLSERDADREGVALDTFKQAFEDVDRALADGETEGFVRIHVAKGQDRILGATVVARHAGEMMNEITFAMTHNIGLGAIASVIHPYPTQAEAIKQAADAYNRTRLTPFVKSLFARLMAWRR